MADEVVAAPEVEAPKKEPTLPEIIVGLGGPDAIAIEQLKKHWGKINVTPLSETEVFIWRTVRRQEWRELQKKVADEKSGWDQLDFEEALVKTCLLWSSGSLDVAGTCNCLAEQIMQTSNFMAPEVASRMIFQL